MSMPELTEIQIRLIEESFAEVAPRGAAMVARFYQRLLNDNPQLNPAFTFDIHRQQKKLLGVLVVVVENLRKPEELQSALEQLGIKQSDFDFLSEQNQVVLSTLLKSLAEYAGDIWGSALEDAWTVAYKTVSSQLIDCKQLAVANA